MDQFVASYKAAMMRYNDFSGRTSVGGFWRFVAVNILLFLVFGILGAVSSLFLIAFMVYWFAVIIPSIAIAVRRLHDTGRSGWMILLGLIPLVGSIILIVFYVQPSDGPNEYGAGPASASEPAPPAW